MAFTVALEDEDFTRSRVDHSEYKKVINLALESGKVAKITLPKDEVPKTIGILRQVASPMGIGLRFDNVEDLGNGTANVRFRTAAKRKFSPESIEKRKATMKKNGTKAGRKATTTKK